MAAGAAAAAAIAAAGGALEEQWPAQNDGTCILCCFTLSLTSHASQSMSGILRGSWQLRRLLQLQDIPGRVLPKEFERVCESRFETAVARIGRWTNAGTNCGAGQNSSCTGGHDVRPARFRSGCLTEESTTMLGLRHVRNVEVHCENLRKSWF